MQTNQRADNSGYFHRHMIVAGLALTGLLVGACSNAGRVRRPPPVETNDLPAFYGAWETYTDQVNASERQPDCRPRLIAARATGERRGAVVMFHGFGGCPQQLFGMAARVAAQGYDVLLPLQPGHGLLPDADGNDDLSHLPQPGEAVNRYGELAVRMNDIMARSPGEKIVVGFSLGGAVSLYASLNAPDLYERQLLLSPMLAIRGGSFIEGLVEVLGHAPGVRNLVVKPGAIRERCHEWQAAGRAGFCDYRLKDVIALLDLEDRNESLYAGRSLKMPIQVVVAGDEKYVSNARIVDLVAQQSRHGPIALCALPADVPHEMLSPYENTGRRMYWLEGLLDGAVGFIVDGRFFASAPGDDQTGSVPTACQLNPSLDRS